MNSDRKIQEKLERTFRKRGFPTIEISVQDCIVYLNGQVTSWNDVVEIGHYAGELKEVKGVINTITAKEVTEREKKAPSTRKIKHEAANLPEKADVVIIGGGVTGCFVARELSRYTLIVVLLEKESDVACGATKANNGQIHTGIGEKSGTLKKELCAKAWPLYERITRELDVPYKKNGLLVILTEDTLPKWIPSPLSRIILKYIVQPLVVKRGKGVGDTPRVVKKEELLEREPHITKKAVSAVLMPGYGILCPYKLTIALAENAIQNGAMIFLETEVTDIITEKNKVKKVVTNRGEIKTKFVVNAAGVYADEVAAMAGAQEYTIHPRKGSLLLFDRKMEGYITHQMSELKFPQDPYTKGGGLLETEDGNMLWGPTAVEVCDKEDTTVSREELKTLIEKYSCTTPDFPPHSAITYFAGVRASTYTEDFVIRASEHVCGFIHAAGIQSPGLAAAPKIAEIVVDILQNEGLSLEEKKNFDPVRKAPPVFARLPAEEKEKLIEKNPLYGNVICRCEHVTEAEIIDAIHGLPPAKTMDAIKRRTRAGMGRCQGGFCGPKVAAILARELGIPLEGVTKDGNGSHLFVRKTKVIA
jgi:glycerol-3-phosphate dehydrogenase